tara:strand:+ start:217 stop:513 length:297 start_codon:yes stop_codon:yes gene_type:complete
MTVLELMERVGMKETTLAIAYIKDAIHHIRSNSIESTKITKMDIIKADDSDDNKYLLPGDMINLESVSVKDTSDGKYKKIRRLNKEPYYMVEDTKPNE